MHQGPISAAVGNLHVHDHLCLVYDTPEQQMAAAIPFIGAGLRAHERCLYIVDESTAGEVYRALSADGIDVAAASDAGALELLTRKESYLRDGSFNPDSMIDLLRQKTLQARSDGYRGLRLAAEMTWALGSDTSPARLLEYESRLNHFFDDHDCLAACQYDRSRFSAQIVRDILYTHPIIVYGSIVSRNPFYIPPEEYFAAPERQAELEVDRILRQLQTLERAQTALLHSEKLAVTGRLSAAIAHEINNPLEAAMNLLYLAQHAGSVGDAARFVQSAQEQLTRVSVIARQTLGFHRGSGGLGPVALRDVIDDVQGLFHDRIAASGVRLLDETGSAGVVQANRGELRQVLANLIANAIDAMQGQPDAVVRIGTSFEGESARITVADNGPGIPPEILGHIFEPFFTTKEQHGTGLGLWVCEDLVTRQHGTLAVETQTSGPRRGTIFTITLPIARAQAA